MKRLSSLTAVALVAAAAACAGGGSDQPGRPAPSTMIVGIDISGSFRNSHYYDDAIDFAALYIYAHLHSLGGLAPPTALFVSSVGGVRAGEPKPFHPINDFEGRTQEQIAADLRSWFPNEDAYTDFNAFFQRTSELVKERGLILAPLNLIILSDGVPDVPPGTRLAANENPYARLDLKPLEFLSRSVTIRLLYANPTVGEDWKRLIPRRRVRIWTQESQVMVGWRNHLKLDQPLDHQDDLWKWVRDNVDFRVRMARLL
jgi:hypothetical protein